MSSPDELLVAAKSICNIAKDEAMYRAAINRLYFSSFHQCRVYHAGLPRVGSVGRASGRHEQLISQLSNPDSKLPKTDRAKSIAIGKELRMLSGKRVNADYDCDLEIKASDMQQSTQIADSIFANTK